MWFSVIVNSPSLNVGATETAPLCTNLWVNSYIRIVDIKTSRLVRNC